MNSRRGRDTKMGPLGWLEMELWDACTEHGASIFHFKIFKVPLPDVSKTVPLTEKWAEMAA